MHTCRIEPRYHPQNSINQIKKRIIVSPPPPKKKKTNNIQHPVLCAVPSMSIKIDLPRYPRYEKEAWIASWSSNTPPRRLHKTPVYTNMIAGTKKEQTMHAIECFAICSWISGACISEFAFQLDKIGHGKKLSVVA